MYMVKVSETPIKVNTPDGQGIIENIIITGLGYIQLRVRFSDVDSSEACTFIKYKVSDLSKLLKGSKVELTKEASNKIIRKK